MMDELDGTTDDAIQQYLREVAEKEAAQQTQTSEAALGDEVQPPPDAAPEPILEAVEKSTPAGGSAAKAARRGGTRGIGARKGRTGRRKRESKKTETEATSPASAGTPRPPEQPVTGEVRAKDQGDRPEAAPKEVRFEEDPIVKNWEVLKNSIKALQLQGNADSAVFMKYYSEAVGHYTRMKNRGITEQYKTHQEHRLKELEDLKRTFEFLSDPKQQTGSVALQEGGAKTLRVNRVALTKRSLDFGMILEETANMDLEELAGLILVEGPKDKDSITRKSRVYRQLEDLFKSGMSLGEMSSVIESEDKARPVYFAREVPRKNFIEAFKVLREDVESDKNNPLLNVARKITTHLAQMSGETISEQDLKDKVKLREAMLKYWTEFGVGVKLSAGSKKPSQELEARDIDASTSLWLFQSAGFKMAKIKHESPGEMGLETGYVLLDTGGQKGAFCFEKMVEGNSQPQTFFGFDNHSKSSSYPGSASKTIYEMLTQAGFFEKSMWKGGRYDRRKGEYNPGKEVVLNESMRNGIEMMVDFSIDDDNASFPTDPHRKWEERSMTLKAVGNWMTANDRFNHFVNNHRPGIPLKDAYNELVVKNTLTQVHLEKYGLDPLQIGETWEGGRQKGRLLMESTRAGYEQAEKVLGRDKAELRKEGRIIESRFGKKGEASEFVVDLALPGKLHSSEQRLRLGHVAARAYGYAGYISIDLSDPKNPRFLVNTFIRNVDFSKDPYFAKLGEQQGVFVRGNIYVKPKDGTPLAVSPEALFLGLTGKDRKFLPKQIRDFLDSYGPITELVRQQNDLLAGLNSKLVKLSVQIAGATKETLPDLQKKYQDEIISVWETFVKEKYPAYPKSETFARGDYDRRWAGFQRDRRLFEQQMGKKMLEFGIENPQDQQESPFEKLQKAADVVLPELDKILAKVRETGYTIELHRQFNEEYEKIRVIYESVREEMPTDPRVADLGTAMNAKVQKFSGMVPAESVAPEATSPRRESRSPEALRREEEQRDEADIRAAVIESVRQGLLDEGHKSDEVDQYLKESYWRGAIEKLVGEAVDELKKA